MQLGNVDQGDIKTEVDSNVQEEGVLFRKFLETAFEKRNVHLRRVSSETDTSIRSQGISENFKLKLKGISSNPFRAVLKKVVAKFGRYYEDAPSLNLPLNPCSPRASMCGVGRIELGLSQWHTCFVNLTPLSFGRSGSIK
uniref:Uncharacterized protein n=1 Tax=Esox lucius TaxID=8010 RepID=A0A3P8Z5Q4_ESOLU